MFQHSKNQPHIKTQVVSFLLIYGGFGVRVLGLGLELDFCGWAFQLMGFWACGVRTSGVFGVGAFSINV